jgi:putative restriction endonuclease
MRSRIERYRRVAPNRFEDYSIGCTILHSPFFFDRDEWIPMPSDFRLNTQVGKTYDATSGTSRALWAEVRTRLEARPFRQPDEVHDSLPGEPPRDWSLAEGPLFGGPLFGEPTLIRPRLGQGSFRILVTDTYRRRCAVTGEKALPALDAAHIRPVAQGGRHRADNGLLLRSDIHRLFDSGYVSITPDYRFRVSSRLKTDFDNGEPYYPLQGEVIWRPPDTNARPGREFLEWHADEVFLG